MLCVIQNFLLYTTHLLQAALGTGLDITRIKTALRQKLEQTGLPFSTADALIEAALDVQTEEFADQDLR